MLKKLKEFLEKRVFKLFPNWYSIDFVIEFDEEKGEDIPSENFMYHPIRRGKYVSLYKDIFVAQFQERIKSHLRERINQFVIPDRTSFYGIFAYHQIYYKSDRYWERDVENSTKSLNDAVFGFFKDEQEKIYGKETTPDSLNDSQIVSQYCQKFASDKPFINSSYYFIGEEYNNTVLEIMYERCTRENY